MRHFVARVNGCSVINDGDADFGSVLTHTFACEWFVTQCSSCGGKGCTPHTWTTTRSQAARRICRTVQRPSRGVWCGGASYPDHHTFRSTPDKAIAGTRRCQTRGRPSDSRPARQRSDPSVWQSYGQSNRLRHKEGWWCSHRLWLSLLELL